jgi:hypothetical protein
LKIGAGKEYFMKHIRLMIAAAVCGVALLLNANANAQDVKQGVVTVVRIHGTATYTADGTTWQPLMLGAILQPGAIIKTSPDSTVDIVLSEKAAAIGGLGQGGGPGVNNAASYAGGLPPSSSGFTAVAQQNVIRIMADTELAVDKLTFSNTGAETTTDTELDLKAGKIFGNVKKISAMSKYEVKTPTGVAGIRGTTFALGADGSVYCSDGSVVVSAMVNNTLVTVVVPAGSVFDPSTGSVTPVTIGSLTPTQAALGVFGTTAQSYNTQATGEVAQNNNATVYISPNN